MRTGPYTLHALDTGRFALDGGAMFGIVPRVLWERRIAPDARHRIPLAARCLLIEGEGRRILVDTGLGDKMDARFAELYAVDRGAATLERSLAARGLAPSDITDVILTHLHFDHAGGATVRGGGRARAAFPEATYYVQQQHWDWAHDPHPREAASFLPDNYDPLAEEGRLQLLSGEQELFPGVHLHVVDGHTRGQQLVRIGGGGAAVLFAADLVPTAAHLPAAWVMGYDIAPLTSVDEKTRLLEQACREGWTLVFEHDAAIEAAHVARGERGRYEAADARPLDG